MDESMGLYLGVLICLAIFFLPTIIALFKKHPKKVGILLVNIVGIFGGLGWLAALIWCFILPKEQSS
ncbi:superinfection immunity protein [Zhongshania marina]|uniref:Superinfection immunity protein n=1 Tax=Zhongshania marina TaxID=2304603 RepID=A0ABX9W7J0_9GAMM|nr:superinfection immunity protein [Zhongshania marina]